MIFNIGSGAGLNFRVVGSAAEPTGPSENTIWIQTETSVTGYVFSMSEPAAPTEGVVWIELSASGYATLNALKRNAIMMTLRNARQYVAGAWVSVTWAIYQGGEWNDPFTGTHFYFNGVVNEALTGGLQARAWKRTTSGESGRAPTYTLIDADSSDWPAVANYAGDYTAAIKMANNAYTAGCLEFVSFIDVTDMASIFIVYNKRKYAASTTTAVLGLFNSQSAATSNAALVASETINMAANDFFASPQTVTLDVSGRTGSYDIAIQIETGGAYDLFIFEWGYTLTA